MKKIDWKRNGTGWKGTVKRRGLNVVAYLITRDGEDYVAKTNPFGYEITRTPSLTVCQEACSRMER